MTDEGAGGSRPYLRDEPMGVNGRGMRIINALALAWACGRTVTGSPVSYNRSVITQSGTHGDEEFMHINGVRLPDDRPLTVDDLERLPDDGNRYELMYGVLEVSPARGGEHGDTLHRLEFLLELCRPAKFKLMGGQGSRPSEWSGSGRSSLRDHAIVAATIA